MRMTKKKIAVAAGVLVMLLLLFNNNNNFKVALNLHDTMNLNDKIQTFRIVINENLTECINHPKDFNINIEKEVWQVLKTSNGTFKMFNAYYDDRSALESQPLVRVVAFSSLPMPTVKTFCQLRYADKSEVVFVSKAEYLLMWHPEWGSNNKGLTPYLISCPNPLAMVPTSVSLVEHECDVPSNLFKVIYEKPENIRKKPIAVVLKDYDIKDDTSLQLVEWIETLLIFGADKIFFYLIEAHSNVLKVLKYYESREKVAIEKTTNPYDFPKTDLQKNQNDMIAFNDCFYKNMYKYDFISPLDIDELIVPVRPEDKTWSDLLARVCVGDYNACVARNAYFLLDNKHWDEIQPEVAT